MARMLTVFYALTIIAELAFLSWRYTTDPPAPSAPLSVWLGWGGLGSMIIMLIYMVARHSKKLRTIARLSSWLNFHVFLGVQGVMFVFFHSLHIFTREGPTYWANPAVINFFAVATVFFSGIFGRYLYSMVPKTVNGEHMVLSQVQEEIQSMRQQLPDEVEALWKQVEKGSSFLGMIRADLATRAALRKLRGFDLSEDVMALAVRRVQLERRIAAWGFADRIFRWWIVLHRPLSGIMYILTAVHVILTYMFTPSLGGS